MLLDLCQLILQQVFTVATKWNCMCLNTWAGVTVQENVDGEEISRYQDNLDSICTKATNLTKTKAVCKLWLLFFLICHQFKLWFGQFYQW